MLINKTSVEEFINEDIILQSCTSLDPHNLIKVKKLKEISLRKLIELGQVDWKKGLPSTSQHRTFLYPCGY